MLHPIGGTGAVSVASSVHAFANLTAKPHRAIFCLPQVNNLYTGVYQAVISLFTGSSITSDTLAVTRTFWVESLVPEPVVEEELVNYDYDSEDFSPRVVA